MNREIWDEQHYKFKRNSGLTKADFECEPIWDRVIFFSCIVIGIIIYIGYGFMGWGN